MEAVALVMIVTAMFAGEVLGQYPCNPSIHCDPRSQQCHPSDYIRAMVRGEPMTEKDYSTSRGICTDAYRWLCDSKGKNCVKKPYTPEALQERCMIILFPCKDCPEAENFKTSDFVYSCQVGKYTCKDGRCVDKATECGASGVRFDNVRCPRDLCGIDDIIEKDCNAMETAPIIPGSPECESENGISLGPCCMTDHSGKCQVIPVEKAALDLSPQKCGNVCNSPTCGNVNSPTASPVSIPADSYDYGIVGMEISFEFGTEEHSCCCRLSCDCFGDPHCTNFFALQQTSKLETGRYRMYEVDKFSLWANLGEPHGVVSKVDITVNDPNYDGTMFSLSSEDCIDLDENKNWRNGKTGEFLTKAQIPQNWYERPTLGNIFSDPNTFYVIDKAAEVAVEIKCASFFTGSTPANRQLRRRLDIHVTKWNDLNNNGCCPTDTESDSWFKQRNAAGYCVGSEPLPGAAQLQGNKAGQQVFLNAAFGLDTPQVKIPSDTGMNDKAEKLCEQYLNLINKPENSGYAIPSLDSITACILNVLDFGLDNLERLIEALSGQEPDCISSFNHPFLLKPFDKCEQGITLETKQPGSSTWQVLRYISASYKFCDNKLYLDFGNLYTADGKTKVTKEFDFQFRRCPLDANECGSCIPLQEVKDIKFEFTYECLGYDNMKQSVKDVILNAFKAGALSCGINYKKEKNPLKCLYDQFPDIFSEAPIPGDETTRKPTARTVPANTKKPTSKPTSKPTRNNDLPIAPKCGKILRYENCIGFANCRWKLFGTGGLCVEKGN